MVTTNKILTILKGMRFIEKNLTDKEVYDSFLSDFAATFDSLMRDKKYLFIECEGFGWVHIYDNDEQLQEMYSKQTCIEEEDDECYVEQITEVISYNEFLEMANGTQLDFERYSVLDGDLIFDFDEE